MPITITIEQQLADKIWSGKGLCIDAKKNHFEAEVLLKEVEGNKVKLHLDSNIKISRINHRDVLHYQNALPIDVEKMEPGATLSFSKIWFNLKK